MNSEKQKEIARKGGRAAHEKGTAHEFTSDEARAAGRKGGERVSVDRSHMSRIGRLGGKSSAGRRNTSPAKNETPKGTDAATSGDTENPENSRASESPVSASNADSSAAEGSAQQA